VSVARWRRRELAEWVAAGFSRSDAIQWLSVGVVAVAVACEYRARGFVAEEGVAWAAAGFRAEQALGWRSAGLSPAAASVWAACGFDAVSSSGYRDFGMSAGAAAGWQAWLGEVVEGAWSQAVMVARLAAAWREAGFDAEGAATWLAAMGAVGRPGGWAATRVSNGWLVFAADAFGEAERVIPVEAAWCRAAGLTPAQGAVLRRGGWLPSMERMSGGVAPPAEAAWLRELARGLAGRDGLVGVDAEVSWLVRAMDEMGSLGDDTIDWLARADRASTAVSVNLN
jgi:hypothetical protein